MTQQRRRSTIPPKHSTQEKKIDCKYQPPNNVCKPPDIIINPPEKDNGKEIKIAKAALWWNKASVILTALVFGGTIFALTQTDDSLKNAKASLEETRNQFETINKPLIQATGVHIRQLAEDKIAQIDIVFKNFGNYPVRIIRGKLQTHISPIVPGFEVVEQGTTFGEDAPGFVSKEEPFTVTYISANNLTRAGLDKVEKEKWRFFLLGYYYYQNLITRDTMAYYFKFRIDYVQKHAQLLYSENEPYQSGIPKQND